MLLVSIQRARLQVTLLPLKCSLSNSSYKFSQFIAANDNFFFFYFLNLFLYYVNRYGISVYQTLEESGSVTRPNYTYILHTIILHLYGAYVIRIQCDIQRDSNHFSAWWIKKDKKMQLFFNWPIDCKYFRTFFFTLINTYTL